MQETSGVAACLDYAKREVIRRNPSGKLKMIYNHCLWCQFVT